MGWNDLAAIEKKKVQQRKISQYVLKPKKSVQSLHWVEAMKEIKENVSVAEMKVCVRDGGEGGRDGSGVRISFSLTSGRIQKPSSSSWGTFCRKNTQHTTDKILLFTLFNTSQHKQSPTEVKHTIVSNITRSIYTVLSLLNIVRIIDNPSTTLGHHSRRYEDL